MRQLPAREITTTIVSFEEQTRGWITLLARTKKLKEQTEIYRRMNRLLDIYCALKVLDFDESAAIEFNKLKKINPRGGTMDLKIASIALSSKATLLSRNIKDFLPIPNLIVEDWTK